MCREGLGSGEEAHVAGRESEGESVAGMVSEGCQGQIVWGLIGQSEDFSFFPK